MFKLPQNLRSILTRLDFYLILSTTLLLIYGIMVIWSTDQGLAHKQLGFALVGALFLGITLVFNYRRLLPLAPFIFGIMLILLLLTLFFGVTAKGASRWFEVGSLIFQPSEFAKLALILFLPWVFKWRRLSPRMRFIVSMAVLGAISLPVLLQPDLGTVLVLICIWLGVTFMANTPFLYFLFLALLGVSALPLAWRFLAPYQKQRVYSFINPQADPLGSGYNVIQAVIAVGSGQVFGRGFGRGPQSQLRFLPERSTDFIFASLAEEWGLLGVTIVFILFFVLLWRILAVGRRSSDGFGALVCTGVFVMILMQFVVNVGMNIGVIPVTGIPLPLVSAGGSSLLVTLLSLGLVGSVALHREG